FAFEFGNPSGFFLRDTPGRLQYAALLDRRWEWRASASASLFSCFLEQDQETMFPKVLQRNHLQIYLADVAILLDPDIFPARGRIALFRLVYQGTQRQHQAFPSHLQHV